MRPPLIDLSGNLIPTQADKAQVPHVLAIPPIRQTWNPNAIEFFFSFGLNVAAATTSALTNSGGPFAVPDRYEARIDYLTTWAPDLILAATPYLFFTISNNQAVVNPFKRVPIFPRTGLSQLIFTTEVIIGSNSNITATAENDDAVNPHFFGMWVHGWTYPIVASDE